MKTTLILLLLFSVSCGKVDMKTGGGVGQIRSIQPQQISVGEHLVFDSICAGLTKKAQRFASSLPSSLTFDVQEKDCDGKTITFGSQQVRVEGSSGSYTFARQDSGGSFIFPNAETTSSGVMKEVCEGAQSMPLINEGEARWVSTTGFSSSECPSASGEQCVLIETASKQGTGDSYRVHTREVVRFNVNANSGKHGYFMYRKKFADSNCDEGDNTEASASLR